MSHDRPTFGSLFAGIGGIDLGLERAGWECRFQVEWDEYCQRVLAKHWPDVPRYGDITTVDWSGVERVDLLAGGFPCQPVSFAGRRAGVDDDRWLWPEFARAIRSLRPRYVLVENVPGLLVGGGMDAVLGGLAELGYDAEWESIPAAALGAPHIRYRVWIIAYANGIEHEGGASADGCPATPLLLADDDGYHGRAPGTGEAQGGPAGHALNGGGSDGAERLLAYAASGIRLGTPSRANGHAALGHEGSGAWWATEPDVGRVAHGVPARVDRLRALGNAVVPQVVEYIGRRILEAEGLR